MARRRNATQRKNRKPTAMPQRIARGTAAAVSLATKVMSPHRSMVPTRDGQSIRLRNCERIVELSTTPGNDMVLARFDFTVHTPGLDWLVNIAKCYGAYRVHRLKFFYVPVVNTATPGTVAMGWFHDSWDAASWVATGTQKQLEMQGRSITTSIWSQDCVMELSERELHQSQNYFDVGTSDGTTTRDSCPGSVGICVIGPTATTAQNFGRLYVEYDVTLVNPTTPAHNVGVTGWRPTPSVGGREVPPPQGSDA